jgi:hypothetical protein
VTLPGTGLGGAALGRPLAPAAVQDDGVGMRRILGEVHAADAELIGEAGHEVLNDVELNQVLVALR